jgi:hypothetical protein
MWRFVAALAYFVSDLGEFCDQLDALCFAAA